MRTHTLYNPLLIDNTAVCGTFGMMIKSREFVGFDEYKYGFNGKENDNEVSGDGNNLDFGNRIYDSRLGKWLSVDSRYMDYPSMSPYNYVNDNPLIFIDPDGNGVEPVITKMGWSVDPITGDRIINIEYTLTINVKIINLSKAAMKSPQDPERFGYDVGQMVAFSYSGEGSFDAKKTDQTFFGGYFSAPQNTRLNVTMKVVVNFEEVKSLDDKRIGPNDNVIAIVDKINPQPTGDAEGLAQRGGNVAVIEAVLNQDGTLNLDRMKGNARHEVGHWIFLGDEYKVKDGVVVDNGGLNVMGAGNGSEINSEQRGWASYNILRAYSLKKSRNEPNPSKIGYDKDIITTVKKFIKENAQTTIQVK